MSDIDKMRTSPFGPRKPREKTVHKHDALCLETCGNPAQLDCHCVCAKCWDKLASKCICPHCNCWRVRMRASA